MAKIDLNSYVNIYLIMAIIEVNGLTRNYGKTLAVDNISFSIKKGEIFGILGPNGAGKTTLVSMLSTVLLPTKGHINVGDFDLLKEAGEIRKIIGLLFQETILDEDLTAYDNIDIHAMLYKLPKEERAKKIKILLELVGLSYVSSHKVSTFSGGMKRKLEIARALVNEPSVLFLDEPTLGLDPRARRDIWNYIKKLNKDKNMTVILTTHYMEEAEELCDRVGIINHGKFVRIDTPMKLKGMLKGDIIEIRVNNSPKAMLSFIKQQKFVTNVDRLPKHFRIYVTNGEKHLAGLVHLFHLKKIKISSILLKKPTLEDVFLHFTGEELK